MPRSEGKEVSREHAGGATSWLNCQATFDTCKTRSQFIRIVCCSSDVVVVDPYLHACFGDVQTVAIAVILLHC